MHTLHKIVKYPMKKRKRSLLSALCCVMIVYAGVQFIFLDEQYSPLQLLSSLESEATRLLRFIGQVHLQCNSSVPTNNASTWLLCLDNDVGLHQWNSEGYKDGIVYSVGPSPDFSFERLVADNMSQHLYIFSAQIPHRSQLVHISNTTSVFKVNIVPNDPADFARNSFETQTLNSVISTLKHRQIDILKLDGNIEGVQSHDILRFLVLDGLLKHVKELHVVLKLDKIEEDDIYSWYRALYGLFNTAGFRLYHTSTSDQLCLQATIMESCTYYLSWVRKPPAHVFVLYPPAIDGSLHHEEDRMLDYLEQPSSADTKLSPVPFTSGLQILNVYMHPSLIPKQKAQICEVVFIVEERDKPVVSPPGIKKAQCHTRTLLYQPGKGRNTPTFYELLYSPAEKNSIGPELSLSATVQLLRDVGTNVLYFDVSPVWTLLSHLLQQAIPKDIDQLVIKDPILTTVKPAKPQPMNLRKKYSELQRVEEFGLRLTQVDKFEEKPLKFSAREMYWLYFVKSSLL